MEVTDAVRDPWSKLQHSLPSAASRELCGEVKKGGVPASETGKPWRRGPHESKRSKANLPS